MLSQEIGLLFEIEMAVSARAIDVTAELWRVVESGNVEALARLLPRVDVNARNRHGMTLLMKAACCGDARMVRLLLEHGADPNLTRTDKFSALALAAFFGHAETVKTLLEFGASTEAVTRSGASARTWATARTFGEVARCLETVPVEVTARTPSHLSRTASSKRTLALGVCAGFVLIICCGLGALVLSSSKANDLPHQRPKPLTTVESTTPDPPPAPEPVQTVVSDPPAASVKTETRTHPVIKKVSAPPIRETKSVSVLKTTPPEKVQINEPPTVAPPKFDSPKPLTLSPQPIAPTKKAKVIQWP